MSIRVRLTLAFSAAMIVLVASGALVLYHQLRVAIDHPLNDGLRTNLGTIAALVAQADTGLRDARLLGPGDGFAQVIDARGGIFDETAGLDGRPLISASRLAGVRRSGSRPLRVDSVLHGRRVRLLARTVRAQDQNLVIVVGASLAGQQSALGALRRELLFGGPIALFIFSCGGYVLASAALRPVERMRRTAKMISLETRDQRLPIGRTGDEISRLAQTLNEMLDRVGTAIERERLFVADASHEIRTPLALLKTEIELALRHSFDASDLRGSLQSVGIEVDRLSQLTESLLLLARSDNGKLPLDLAPVDPATILCTIALRYESRAGERGRCITTRSSVAGIVMCDELLIEHALGNLVDNALHHGKGVVALHAFERGGALELHCCDDGPGFEPAIAATAFNRFTRADLGRSGAGAGLGLAIVAAIAATHAGSAHLESGSGVDVWIRLPLQLERSDP